MSWSDKEGQFREFKNPAKIIIIIAKLKKNEISRIPNFVKSPKVRNSRKFKHAKITRSTVYYQISRGSASGGQRVINGFCMFFLFVNLFPHQQFNIQLSAAIRKMPDPEFTQETQYFGPMLW